MRMRTVLLSLLAALAAACAPMRPPPVPTAGLPWGAVDLSTDPPQVVLSGDRRATLPPALDAASELPRRGPHH